MRIPKSRRMVPPRGFTLVELLVVMAILTLLTSIVLATLNAARINASNSAVQAQLAAIRTEAGLIYLNNGNYDTLCASGTNSWQIFKNATLDAAQGSGADGICLSSSTGELDYNSGGVVLAGKAATPGSWAVSLRQRDGKYYCVDSTGVSQVQATRGLSSSPADLLCN